VRPERASSTICCRNSGAYGGFDLGIVNISCSKDRISTKAGQIHRATLTDYIPIFVFGCERSGTTLLASLLGSAPQYLSTPEGQFKKFLIKEGTDNQICRKIITSLRFQLWNIPVTEGELIKVAQEEGIAGIMQMILTSYQNVHGEKDDALYWVDHDPRTHLYTKGLLRLFPDARFIHIVRDGRAVAASIKPLDWGPNTTYYAAAFWEKFTRAALEKEGELPRGRVVRIRFEELLSDPRSTLESMCQGLSIPFSEQMLEGGGVVVPSTSKRQHAEVGGGVNKSRSQSWKRELSKRQVNVFEGVAGQLLKELGYRIESDGLPGKAPNKLEVKLYALLENIKGKRNRKRFQKRYKEYLE